MVDMTDVIGENPLRVSLMKKRAKMQERIDLALKKLAPLQIEYDMYDEMLAAMDKKELAARGLPEIPDSAESPEKKIEQDAPPMRQTDIEEFTKP